jgi:hypothetical protein
MSRSKKNAQRDYKKEYRDYHSKPGQLKDNNARHRARYHAEKKGTVKVGDGKDIHHKDNNPRNNSPGNHQIMSASRNRSRKPNRKKS